jgi:hypothetical protein
VAVLGVAPGAFGSVEAARAGGVFINALLAGAPEGDEDVARAAVMDDGAKIGVVVSGITDFRAEHVEVLVMHHADLPFGSGQIFELDLADEDRPVEIDDVVAVHRELQIAMI